MRRSSETNTATATTGDRAASLIDGVLEETACARRDDECFAVYRQGLSAALQRYARDGQRFGRFDREAVDAMIADIDHLLTRQVNAILHHPDFQRVEAAWRGLRYLVDNVDFRENVRVEVLHCTKDELVEDFEDAPEIPKSGLYKLVYSDAYGTWGARPYGLVVGNYDFSSNARDVELLRQVAAVAAMAHAPFVSNAGPEFFGRASFEEVVRLRDLEGHFEGPEYAAWRSFRESDDARNVGLCLPRFLLRRPYDPETSSVRAFHFLEDATGHHDRYLWGHSSIAFATRVADSFARYRWCPNIIGPRSGGAVENLPLHVYREGGELTAKIPTEVLLTERRDFELSEQGFIPLVFKKGHDIACFFSANSTQRPRVFANNADGQAASLNYRLGTRLPYMFIINRLAHYIKAIQREQLGSAREQRELERDLNAWISQYVADMESPSAETRARRPLRQAKVTVEPIPGQPGLYRSHICVRPHFKYEGASFTLSLVGRIDDKT
ncbi:MAG: type VI secretion system contractile sheath large subunit [Nannocystaceae bacterium]|nr:type VI secretion system contractile sheath large subunit [Myxococcales bacterium]